MDPPAAQRLYDAKIGIPPIYQLNPADAGLFKARVDEVARRYPNLHLRDLAEYQAPGVALFVTGDGGAGGAVIHGELVSLFKVGQTTAETPPHVSRVLQDVRRNCGGEFIICRGPALRKMNEFSGFAPLFQTEAEDLDNPPPGDDGNLWIMCDDRQAVEDGVEPVPVATEELATQYARQYGRTLATQGREAAYEFLDALRSGVAVELLTAMDAIAEPHRGSMSTRDASVRVDDPGSGQVNTTGLDTAGGAESGPSLSSP